MRATTTRCLLFFALNAALVHLVAAQEPPATEDDAAKKFRAYAKEAAESYTIRLESSEGRQLTLRDQPVLRWANPLDGHNSHGDVFLWTDEGRPAAVLSLYEYTAAKGTIHEHHEFCSLATVPLVTEVASGRNWSPKEAGLTFAPLPAAPAPAGSAVRRLAQMRELAARFTGKKTTRGDAEVRELRLMPQPVVRYESKYHEVLDGALFALVEANDPEVFVLIEARPVEGKLQWHYGLARMNSLGLAVSLDEAEVWKADLLPWRDALNRKDLPYTAFTIR